MPISLCHYRQFAGMLLLAFFAGGCKQPKPSAIKRAELQLEMHTNVQEKEQGRTGNSSAEPLLNRKAFITVKGPARSEKYDKVSLVVYKIKPGSKESLQTGILIRDDTFNGIKKLVNFERDQKFWFGAVGYKKGKLVASSDPTDSKCDIKGATAGNIEEVEVTMCDIPSVGNTADNSSNPVDAELFPVQGD